MVVFWAILYLVVGTLVLAVSGRAGKEMPRLMVYFQFWMWPFALITVIPTAIATKVGIKVV